MKTLQRQIPLVSHSYIDGIRVGKRSTLDNVYKDFFPRVKHFILQHSGTLEDAKDIFQEALLVIYNNVRDKDFELTCQFGTYLYAICRNIWFKQIRDKDVSIIDSNEIAIAIDLEELEEAVVWLERYKIYRRQFLKISEKCQELLRLYLEGSDMGLIAEQLGFASVSYARKRKFKCKEQLIFKIEQDQDFKKLCEND